MAGENIDLKLRLSLRERTVYYFKVEAVKLRRKACPETVVELTPADFNVLTKASIVDCNDLKEIS